MAQTQGFMTALYERLSRDDELNGKSNNISNQKSCWSSMQKSMVLPIWKFILTSSANIYRHISVR